jgi:selenocysteine-specific translation elongation factor
LPLTIGTAVTRQGKTALIRALTGVDTDRLPEERGAGSRSSSATRR